MTKMIGMLLATVHILVKQPTEYVPHLDERFGFSFDRPTFLRPGHPPENGDGLEFRNTDGKVRLLAYGSGSWNHPSLESERRRELGDLHRRKISPSLDQRGPGWFAMSYKRGGYVFYEKTYMTQDALMCLRLQYPASDKARMDRVLTRVVRSFRPGVPLINR